ncbi:MAG TPA: endo alpha-1,4 polygalactosaminidase, partial [Flavobacterium sp.]|nr:endo alpha-1,4 polygalactosaminidase [Flavobacterium sp.]
EFETKEAFLKAVEATNYDLIVIDLYYDNTAFPLTAYDVARLKKKANGGKRLALSYINVGAAENWRYYWQPEWKLESPAFLKKKYQGYDNEFYVQYWDGEWRDIIFGNDDSYMRKILDAGFDGAYLDNMEAYIYLSK